MDGIRVVKKFRPDLHALGAHGGDADRLERVAGVHASFLRGSTQTLVVLNTGVPSGRDSSNTYSSMSMTPSLRLGLRIRLTMRPVMRYGWPVISGREKATVDEAIMGPSSTSNSQEAHRPATGRDMST